MNDSEQIRNLCNDLEGAISRHSVGIEVTVDDYGDVVEVQFYEPDGDLPIGKINVFTSEGADRQ